MAAALAMGHGLVGGRRGVRHRQATAAARRPRGPPNPAAGAARPSTSRPTTSLALGRLLPVLGQKHPSLVARAEDGEAAGVGEGAPDGKEAPVDDDTPQAETMFKKKRALGKKARAEVQAKLQALVAESEAKAIANGKLKDFKEVPAEQVYGPKALLLVGFKQAEAETVQGWFAQMDPEVAVRHVTNGMLGMTLDDLLWGREDELKDSGESRVKDVRGTPRVCIFAGISGEETVAVIEIWETVTSIDPPLFATATLGNAEAPLKVVLEEMAGAAVDAGEEAPRGKFEGKVITMGPAKEKGS